MDFETLRNDVNCSLIAFHREFSSRVGLKDGSTTMLFLRGGKVEGKIERGKKSSCEKMQSLSPPFLSASRSDTYIQLACSGSFGAFGTERVVTVRQFPAG